MPPAAPARLFRVCLLLATLACFFVTGASSSQRTLRIGFLGSTNLPNSNTQVGGAPALFASRLAIRHVNANTQVLPNITLELVSNNTNSDVGTGNWLAYHQIQSHGVVSIVGEFNSPVTAAASYPTRFLQVPIVSYGSSSPDFTTFHAEQYPYFLRMCPSTTVEAQLLASVIANQGWARVGLIYTTDSAGMAGALAFQLMAQKVGISIVGFATFGYSANLFDVHLALAHFQSMDITIFLFIGSIFDMQTIIYACAVGGPNGESPLGLYGKGYQWVGLHSYLYPSLFTNSSGDIVPYIYDFAQGMIGLQNFADVESNEYQSMAAAWAATPAQADLPTVIPTDPDSITTPGSMAYDAVWFLAYALDRMENEFGIDMSTATSYERELFLAVLKNVTFDGVTGNVTVDQNGDRLAPFSIVNVQGASVVKVGVVSLSGGVSMSTTTSVIYSGGKKALDHHVRGIYVIPYAVRVGMTFVIALCLVIFICGILVVIYLREVTVMKVASPTFMILMQVGAMLLVSTTITRVYENYSPSIANCSYTLITANYGHTLMVGSLLVKTYRVDSIFRMRHFHTRVLTDYHLFGVLVLLMSMQTAFLVPLYEIYPPKMATAQYDSTRDYQFCSSNTKNPMYTAWIISFRFVLIAITAVYTYRIRNLPADYNEASQLGIAVYNFAFFSALMVTIDSILGRGKADGAIAFGLSACALSLLTCGVMLLPKIRHYIHGGPPTILCDDKDETYLQESDEPRSETTKILETPGVPKVVKAAGAPTSMPHGRSRRASAPTLIQMAAMPSPDGPHHDDAAVGASDLASPPAASDARVGLVNSALNALSPAVLSSHATTTSSGSTSRSRSHTPRMHVGTGVGPELRRLLVHHMPPDGPHQPALAVSLASMRSYASAPAPSPVSPHALGNVVLHIDSSPEPQVVRWSPASSNSSSGAGELEMGALPEQTEHITRAATD